MSVDVRIEEANKKVMNILTGARPVWKDIRKAVDVIPGMTKQTILIPGPPIAPDRLPIPVKTSVCGAVVHEGLAKDTESAWKLVLKGEIKVEPAQDHNCSCAASMVTSASMPVFVVEDPVFKGQGFCTLHPGLKPKVLRWGFYDEEVENDLQHLEDPFSVVLGEAVRRSGGIDLVNVLSKTAGMGDENHNRQPAASMYLALQMLPYLLDTKHPDRDLVIKEYCINHRFFLHVMMAGVGSITAAAKQVPFSTVMVGMGGNGVEFGIQVAATGNTWYTTEAPLILGIFLEPTYTKDDLLGYLGDSCVTEVYGLGGMSALAGPAYAQTTGATFADARDRTERARAVSLGEHTFARIPWDDFRGLPVGIDVQKAVELDILPISHGGSALKTGGQGGAGATEIPMNCFKKALQGVHRALSNQ